MFNVKFVLICCNVASVGKQLCFDTCVCMSIRLASSEFAHLDALT